METSGRGRREFVKAAAGAAGLSMLAPGRAFAFAPAQAAVPAASQAATTPVVSTLADDLHIITLPRQPNVVAQTGRDGVLLVDGCAAEASEALMRAVASLPGGGPVHTIFNTHWHPEQVGSNEALGKAGKTIIAHENTRLWLTTDVKWPWNGRTFTRLPKAAQPNKTFYTTGALDSGVRYGYIPDVAHTDGDLYVFFPQQNVLAVGDVVSNQGWPVVDWVTGGWIGGIVGGLQRLSTLADDKTRIVPARGPVMSLAELKAQFEMYSTIYERLTGMLNKGRGPAEAVAAAPTKEFDARMGNGDEFVRRSFESLWAYLSPDA